jgi:hypothetical protein
VVTTVVEVGAAVVVLVVVDCEQEANTSEITRMNARINNIGRLFM